MKTTKVCPTCKKEFKSWKSQRAIYCSRKCYTKIGSMNPKWHGGYLICDGYKYIYKPDHPLATQMGYVVEHRLIAEKILGRYLKKKEKVHHINYNRLDNRLENLLLCGSDRVHFFFHSRRRDKWGRFAPDKGECKPYHNRWPLGYKPKTKRK